MFLGFCYYLGCDEAGFHDENPREAEGLTLLEQAADQGYLRAQNMLLTAYLEKKDSAAYATHLAKYAESGKNEAVTKAYAKGLLTGAHGIDKDVVKGLSLVGDTKDEEVLLAIGDLYGKGESVEKDNRQALKYYQLAVQGDAYSLSEGMQKSPSPAKATAAARAANILMFSHDPAVRSYRKAASLMTYSQQGEITDAALKNLNERYAEQVHLRARQFSILCEELGTARKTTRTYGYGDHGLGTMLRTGELDYRGSLTFTVSEKDLDDEWNLGNNPSSTEMNQAMPFPSPWKVSDASIMTVTARHDSRQVLTSVKAKILFGDMSAYETYFKECVVAISSYYDAPAPKVETVLNADGFSSRQQAVWGLRFVTVKLTYDMSVGIVFSVAMGSDKPAKPVIPDAILGVRFGQDVSDDDSFTNEDTRWVDDKGNVTFTKNIVSNVMGEDELKKSIPCVPSMPNAGKEAALWVRGYVASGKTRVSQIKLSWISTSNMFTTYETVLAYYEKLFGVKGEDMGGFGKKLVVSNGTIYVILGKTGLVGNPSEGVKETAVTVTFLKK